MWYMKSHTKDMKKLIINADEFGIARCATDAIWECLNNGVLTSTTIVAGGLDFVRAASLVKEREVCGLHLSLVDYIPSSPKDRIGSLLRRDRERLWPLKEFLPRYFSGKIKRDEIEIELESQIVKCLDHHIGLTHLDAHCNLHMIPEIFRIVMRLMDKYKIRNFRFSREPFLNIDWSQPVQYAIKCAVTLSAIYNKRNIPAGVRYTDNFIGMANSARITEKVMLHFLERLPDGVTEIPIHPRNYDEREIMEAFGDTFYPTDYFRKGNNEKEALLSERVRRMISEKKIVLISYKGL